MIFKRSTLFAAMATVLGGATPVPAAYATPTVSKAEFGPASYVVVPPGIYAGNESGLKLIHDYGAFQLWRVDAAHRNELLMAAGNEVRVQPDSLGFEAGAIAAQRTRADDSLIPLAFRSSKSPGDQVHYVQFAGPVVDSWLDAVRGAGAKLIQPISGNGYLVLTDDAAQRSLFTLEQQSEVVIATGQLVPYFKLSSELAAKARAGMAPGNILDITVQVAKHAGNAASKGRIASFNMSGVGLTWSDRRTLESTHLSVDASAIEKIAVLGDVVAMEIHHPRRKFDEVQGQIMAGNFNGPKSGPSGPGYFAWLTGLGFSTNPADYPIVDVVDDGLGTGAAATAAGDDTLRVQGNNALASRVQYIVNCTPDALGDGAGGHGHLNTNVVGGYDQTAVFPYTDDNGYLRGQGINPFTRLAHTKIFRNAGTYSVTNCGGTDAGVIKSSQDMGAVITSNSWGAGVSGNYDDSSQAYDIGTRDGDLVQAGNQPMIHIFAAGNDGSGAATVGSPGSGKNMITVGASENFRATDEDGAWTDGCGIGGTGANNAMDVISFSSRGPAEGGRTKPEVIAPGTHIQGTASTGAAYNGTGVCDQYRPSGQSVFASSSGTSHSTPATAGTVSLLYRWLQTEYADAAPSAAMIKAYLMAHPTYLNGVGANDNLPSNTQGYGMPNMGAMFDNTTARVVEDQTTTFGAAGQVFTWAGSVTDTGKPVRIAVAWSDAPGAITDTTPQVNDLNLSVAVGGNTYLGNRFTGAFSVTGGSADAANNYEAVFLPAGTSGAMTITVTAAAISGDGVPSNADTTDQDFAFVCNNCSQTPDFTVDATPTLAQVCSPVDANWNVAVGSINGYSGNVTLSASGAPAGSTIGFSSNPVSAPGGSVLALGTAAVATGDYNFNVVGNDGLNSHSDPISLQIDASAPVASTLSVPANGATGVATQPSLSWSAVAGARDYTVEIDDDPGFGSIDYSATVAGTSHGVTSSLSPNTNYYWRVRAGNHCGAGSNSAVFSFTTANLVCQIFPSTDVPKRIPAAGTSGSNTSTLTSTLAGTVTDINVLNLAGTHTWMGDLDFNLTSPDATSVAIMDTGTCGSLDNFNINLDDAAAGAFPCPPVGGGTFLPSNPLAAFIGEASDGTWTLTINDAATGDTGQLDTWSLEICATVAPPAVDAINDTVVATEDTQLNQAAPGVLGNDVGSGLSASVATQPVNGTLVGGVVNADGSFSYVPATDACGVAADSFTYTATDGVGSDTATVTIDITCQNDPPVADADAYSVNEDTQLSIIAPGVLDGDTDVDSGSLTATNLVQPTNGTVALNGDGSLTYDPDANYCNDGSPTDDFTYTANDGALDSVPGTVSITVNCIDDPAVANDDSATVAEDDPATAIDVLGNDNDPESDAFVITGVTQPANGTVAITGGGTGLTYQPGANYCDDGTPTDDFTYTITGGDTATVAVTVTCVDDPTSLSDDSATVTEDDPATAIDVLGNDSDPDTTLLITGTSNPAGGTVVITGAGTGLTYQPDANFCNDGTPTDDFTYTVNGADTANVTVTVTCVDDPAVANDDIATFAEDDSATAIDVLGNDNDPESDAFVITGVTQPANGTVAITGGGTGLTYQPGANYCDDGTPTDDFTYTITGGDTATVAVTVTCVDDPTSLSDDSATVTEDDPATAIDVLGNDSDPDTTLLITGTSNPAGGTVVITGAGTGLTYQPDANFCNDGTPTDDFTYTVNGADTANVTVTVTCVDDPAVANDDSVTVTEDDPATAIDVLGNDSDPDTTLLITGTSNPAGGTVVITGAGTGLTYQPDANFCNDGTPTDDFTYTVNGTDTANVTVTVTCVDDGPAVANDDGPITVLEDSSATVIDVLANDVADPDDSSLAVTAVGTAGNGTTSFTAGNVSYTPAANYCGADSFSYTINGGDTATVTMDVTCVDDGPAVANDDGPVTVLEDSSATVIDVLANDVADPDDSSLSVTAVGAAGNGSTSFTAGNVSYTPAANYCGADSFSYTVNGGDTATVSVTVSCANDAPSITSNAPATATEDVAYSYVPTVNDPDGPGTNWSVLGADTCGGSFTGSTYGFTPAGPAPAADCTLSIQVCDGGSPGECDSETVLITITAVDDGAAIANDDSATVAEDSGATAIAVLANDIADPDDSSLAVTAVGTASNGSTSFTAVNVSYTPDANYCGADSFSYTVNGGDTATVTMDVTCVDDGPAVANDDGPVTVLEDSSATVIDVLANDVADPDDSSLAVTAVGAAGNGSTSFTAGNVSYTPAANYCGADSFSYTVNGGDTATVTMDVTCVDDGPAVANDDGPVTVLEDSSATVIDVLANDVADPDDSSLAVTAVGAAGNGSTSFTAGDVSYTPDANYCGADSFSYTINGGDTATVTMDVTCVDDGAAVANDDTTTVAEDSGTTVIDVLSNDVADPDDSSLSVIAVGTTANGTTGFTSGNVSYTPKANFCGPDSFSYTVNGGDTATVSVTVSCSNDGPSISSTAPATATEDVAYSYAPTVSDPDGPGTNWTVLGADTCGGSFTGSTYGFTPAGPTPPANCTVSIQVCDGGLPNLCDSQTALITITAVDDGAAVANDDLATVVEDSGTNVIAVLSNDVADPDTSNLSVIAVGAAGNGSTSFTAGNVSYTPDANYCGADSFSYNVNGGDTATVSVTVTCVDDGPAVANDDSANVTQSSVGNLIAVLANDVADPDDASLNLTSVGAPGNGTAVISGSQISYTPTAGYCGNDSFTYQVNGAISATVNVTISCSDPDIFRDGFEN